MERLRGNGRHNLFEMKSKTLLSSATVRRVLVFSTVLLLSFDIGEAFLRSCLSENFGTARVRQHELKDSNAIRSLTDSGHNRIRFFTTLWMGKGDGKKKRTKKSSSSSDAQPVASPSQSPAPMRVTSDSIVPVRHQLAWAKMNKEFQRQQANPGFRQKKIERTAFRKTWSEEEMEEKAEERKKKGQDPDWDVILSRTASSPLVIVDGYNIIHKWSRLKKHMAKGDTARARQLLVDDLENLASIKGWRIEVVFDGMGRSTIGPLGQGPGDSSKPTQKDKLASASVSKHGVRVVYSGIGMEADSYIEARCAEAKNVTSGELTGSFIVATDDSMIRLAGQSAGAWCMGADRFVTELKAVKGLIGYRVEAAMAKVNGHEIRPEQLRNRPVRFGKNSVLIEDKRNRTKTRRQEEELLEDIELNLTVEEIDGIPWWAQMPKDATLYRNN